MGQKINAIVFSRDKAPQLKLFLDSVNKHARGQLNVSVIIGFTSDEFAAGYKLVTEDKSFDWVNFIPEKPEFREQVLRIIKEGDDYTSFFLDDDIFYGEICAHDIIEHINNDDDVVCMSLRLGENTTNCYTLSTENVMHDIKKVSMGYMKWDWSLHYLDFGYPFSMNGHVFRKKDIYKLVRKSRFVNVEELEMSLFDYTELYPRNLMVSHQKSVLVNVPIGRVQLSIENDMASAMKESRARVTRKNMNKAFVSGDFINLEEIDFSDITGCHQELDLGDFLGKSDETMDLIASKKHGKLFNELDDEQKKEIEGSVERIDEMMKQKEDEQD